MSALASTIYGIPGLAAHYNVPVYRVRKWLAQGCPRRVEGKRVIAFIPHKVDAWLRKFEQGDCT
jgi:hypothetical protein